MPDDNPSAMASHPPSGRPTRSRSTSRPSISSLAAVRSQQHKPREEERKEEERDDSDASDSSLPLTSSGAVSSSSYPALLSSLSANLRSRHSAVQSRLRSLSADHQQCKQQLLSALTSYVSLAQRQLTAKQQQLIGHIHSLDALDHTLTLPSLSAHQQKQAERDVHDLLTVVEQLPADTQPPFDPFQVGAVQQLTDDNKGLAAELEEAKRAHQKDKAELQVELDRLIAQHEQMQSVIEQLTTAHHQQQQQQQPHTADEWKRTEDTAALLIDTQRQLETLTQENNALKRQRQQSEQAARDTQAAWSRAKQQMDSERREWAEERERRVEEDEKRAEARAGEEKRWQGEREDRREQHRERTAQEVRQQEKQREQQRQDEMRQHERAARQREVEKERDAIDKQRLQDELDHMQAGLTTAERERREWLREKREWQDEKDKEETERDERETERDRDQQRLLEREAAALSELRREKQRMEVDVKGEAGRRILAFIRTHGQRVDAASRRITALLQQVTDDGIRQVLVQSVEAVELDDTDTAVAAFDAAVDCLLTVVDRYIARIAELREDDKRRADETLLASQEKMGDRLTQLIRTHAAEAQERQKQQQQQQAHRDRRAEEDELSRQLQTAVQQQQRQQEEEQWKREREDERAEWDAERRRLEQDRREEVRAAILSCHRDWRAKEDELRRQHQQRFDAALQQAKEDSQQRIEQQQLETQQQSAQLQQQWDDERTELLAAHQKATQHHNQQLDHLQQQLHALTLHTQQADDRHSLALAALQRSANDEVRRVRREAVEGHDRIAAALIESRAEVGRLLQSREREKVDVELMRRQVSEWQADRRQWQDEKAALQHEAERQQKEAERRWQTHIEEQRMEWERSRRVERDTWKTEVEAKRRKEQQRWEQRMKQVETELSQQLTELVAQRVHDAEQKAQLYKQQADKQAQRYREQVDADARRRQQLLQEERQTMEREAQEVRQQLQREKQLIEQQARDNIATAHSASASATAAANAVDAVKRHTLSNSSPSLTATPAAVVSRQSVERLDVPIETQRPSLGDVDRVYDDGDSSDDEDVYSHEVTLQEASGDARAHLSSEVSDSRPLPSSSRLSAARSASLSILASLPPSTFATGLLTRLASQSDPPAASVTRTMSAVVPPALSSPRLSSAALYWRSRPSSTSEQPSGGSIGILDVSAISEQVSVSGDAAAVDISSTTATRATTPSTSMLPSPETNRRTIDSYKRSSMPSLHATGPKGKQADSRARANTAVPR